MRNILVIGAGKSTSYLIKYFIDKADTENLHLTIGDIDVQKAKEITGNNPNVDVIFLDVFDKEPTQKGDLFLDLDNIIPPSPAVTVRVYCDGAGVSGSGV